MGIMGIDLELTGMWLQKVCQYNSLTIREVQQYLGLAYPQSIYRWFRGLILPSIDHLYLLSGLLKRNIDDLLIGNRMWNGRRLCCYYLLICKREEQTWSKRRIAQEAVRKSAIRKSEPNKAKPSESGLPCTSNPMTEVKICANLFDELADRKLQSVKLQNGKKGGAVCREPIYQRRGGTV